MKLASVRLVTREFDRLVSFYTLLTEIDAVRLAPEFAEVRLDAAVLAISGEGLIRQFNAGAAVAAANRSSILEFQVDDVDAVHHRLGTESVDCVMPPTQMPWGNRSMLLRDPDGNLVNVFSKPAL